MVPVEWDVIDKEMAREPQESTADVHPRFLHTVTIHGREYQKHAIDNAVQFLPIDEEEAERLESQHRVFNMVFDDRLVFPPVGNMSKILDLGYGAASWALEVANAFPDCEVTGVDISLHMLPDELPDNFEPQLDDLNRRFTFPSNSFDLVHSRLIGGGLNKNRWPTYVKDIARVLCPGGWCQMVEYYHMCQSDNGSLSESSPLRRWSVDYMRSIETLKDPRAPMQMQAMFNAAGLINVESRMIPIPLCGWPTGVRERKIGELNKPVALQTLRNMSLFPLTRRLGMKLHDCEKMIEQACLQAADPKIKAYFPLYVCIGQKPEARKLS